MDIRYQFLLNFNLLQICQVYIMYIEINLLQLLQDVENRV
jgi:hypothetical protein